MELPAAAYLGGQLATGLRDVTDDVSALDSAGWWAVVADYDGTTWCARFDDVRPVPLTAEALGNSVGDWRGPGVSDWRTSMSRTQYVAAVERVRELIRAGEIYQANVCRVLSAPLPDPARVDVLGLAVRLAAGNPAPYLGAVRLPGHDIAVATASPELFLRRATGPDGETSLTSRPIKGTGADAAAIGAKDRAENVMIVDLVRNDLGAISETGSVSVPELCALEEHPGLVHLVSTVRGNLRPDVGWSETFAATFPPGSVTGAPKSRALEVIAEVESAERGPYCGAVGWVDADRGRAELAVAIRTFWAADGHLRFGTGAGITWASDAEQEWSETELKASHLLAVAAGTGARG